MAAKAPRVEFGKNYHTAQIYSKGFEFAFMGRKGRRKTYEQACTFVYCKDFLHDAIWAFLNKTKVSIYSFVYDVKKNIPLVINETALAFRNTQYKDSADEFHGRLDGALEFLQAVDHQLGFQPTQIFVVPHKDGPCWLILGDRRWQLAPTMISFYTLLIRIAFYHKPGTPFLKTIGLAEKGKIKIGEGSGYAGNRDCSYVKSARKGIDAILKHGASIFFDKMEENYPENLLKNGLHDSYGIVNFTQGLPKRNMPHWYRKEVWK